MDNPIAMLSSKFFPSAFYRQCRVLVVCCLFCLAGPALHSPAFAAELAADPPGGATNPPLISIQQFLDGAPTWGEQRPVRVRGTVTHSISDNTFFIQEGDAGTYVFHKPAQAFRVGELVEVAGYPSLKFRPTLNRCRAQALGPGVMPAPVTLPPAAALAGAGHMRLIRVQGVLAAERLRGGYVLVLHGGGFAFTADLESFSDLQPFDRFEAGSRLELTGVCSIQRGPDEKPASFNVFIHSPSDITVIAPPPWWTPARTGRVLGLAVFGLALTLAWVLTLRTQVRRQTTQVRLLNEQLEQRVQQRTAELTEANRELEAFTQSVSHDLRAPLRHISGFADIAASHPAAAQNEELQKPLQQITTAAARLGRLMDDLLAFSRVTRRTLARQPVALAPLLAEVQRELQPDTAGRSVEWKIAPLPEVSGDPATLRIVWHNLLANSVKYTRHRTPAIIEVNCRPAETEWIFSVRDNGAGFDMQYADRLFSVFQRLHPEQEFEGTGLGLANVRRIVERHGGRVWAEGEVNRGATFYFTLPRQPDQPSRSTAAGSLFPAPEEPAAQRQP